MAPQLLFPLEGIDLSRVIHDAAAIEAVNPHRGAMRQIDAVVWECDDPIRLLAYRDIRDDEFWVPGHLPGRPLFPGVLMIEAAAQVASFACLTRGKMNFMGFAGIDGVKFRGMVTPGDRLHILCEQLDLRPRRSICMTQGVVNGNLVFEAKVTGMPF